MKLMTMMQVIEKYSNDKYSLTPENINTLVDLQTDMIQLDTKRLVSNTHCLSIVGNELEEESMESPARKRRSFARNNTNDSSVKSTDSSITITAQKGIQMMYVPSYTIQVRSLLIRSFIIKNFIF